jgi:predicted acyltransferase
VSKQNEKAMKLERSASLDAFRGFDILVMIFVNYVAGICCLLFLFFYVLMDVLKIRRWSSFLQPIGQNPLLTYILPSLVGYVISFASTGLILLITWAMTRAKIILKI